MNVTGERCVMPQIFPSVRTKQILLVLISLSLCLSLICIDMHNQVTENDLHVTLSKKQTNPTINIKCHPQKSQRA